MAVEQALTVDGPSPVVPDHPDDIASHLRLSVTRLARLLRQQDQSGLGPTLTAALATIAREGEPTLGELAAQEQVAPPTITRVVGKLEAKGLVIRKVDDEDRRISRVRVSPAGRRQLDDSRIRRTAWLATRLQELSPDELDRLADALGVLDKLTTARCEDRAPKA